MSPCWRCGRPIVVEGRIGRQDLCEGCHSSLHACKNCKDWDKNVHNQCKEPQAEFVADREGGNFCTFFKLKVLRQGEPDESALAKDKLASVFAGLGGAAAPSLIPRSEDDAKARLERAFKGGGGETQSEAGSSEIVPSSPSGADPKQRLEELFKKK